MTLASQGYPDPKKYKIGFPITGIDQAEDIPGVKVFHCGTAYKDSQLVTNGGRVLAVTAERRNLKDAISTAYQAVERIQFQGKTFRPDIGRSVLARSF